MFKHSGPARTSKHNMELAVMLGLTAGFVNAAGFLGFSVLTTNVTGHAALFAERIAAHDWQAARIIALWMFVFLAGAFLSSLITNVLHPNQRYSYVIPILAEILILFGVAMLGHRYDGTLSANELFSGSLLFAMGIQNSLVSIVSGAVVRTTHLTGTFTDLGIDLARLFSKNINRLHLLTKIKLHCAIIFFFMAGALTGAWAFTLMDFRCFLIPVILLAFILAYDVYQIRLKKYYYKLKH